MQYNREGERISMLLMISNFKVGASQLLVPLNPITNPRHLGESFWRLVKFKKIFGIFLWQKLINY